MEQFDDMLRTFINEMNTFENRFGKIRDHSTINPETLLDDARQHHYFDAEGAAPSFSFGKETLVLR